MSSRCNTFNVWEGVYGTFAEAKGDQNVFNDTTWVKRAEEKAIALRARYANAVGPQLSTQDYCLPVLAAVCAATSHRLRILDFGGALGFSFFPVRAALPAATNLAFHIVEQPALARVGRELLADEQGLFFHDDLSAVDGPIDIVHSGSVLQYLDDWRRILRRLCQFKAPFLVLDDLLAGDIETYASLQNYYGRKIPCWFWNLDDFIDEVRACGYAPIFQTRFVARILDRTGPLPMENFPVGRRLQHAVNVIFRRLDA